MVDNIQGSSTSSLQNKLIALATGAGKPAGFVDGKEGEVSSVKQSEELEVYRDDKRQEELKKQLVELSGKLNEEMRRINTDIDFNYNDDIRGLVVTVREANDDKIIREIPSKEAIELMKKMHDIVGLIFDKKG